MILLYDKNNISIEGDTNDTFTEDVAKRFDAYGWQVIEVRDGNTDVDAIDAAISRAKAEKDKPTIIIVHTTIGYGCPPVAGTASCHGNPLGANISVLKKTLGVPEDKEFYVPEEVYENAKKSGKKALEAQTAWNAMFQEYKKEYPELAKLYKQYMSPVDKSIFDDPAFYEFEKGMASRQSSGIILNRLAEKLPQLMGGSADLAPSNNTLLKSREYFNYDNYAGSNIHYGIREFSMAAIANGMYLHGGVIPFVATFFVFSDYLKHAIRLSALIEITGYLCNDA